MSGNHFLIEVQQEWARLSESRGCGFESCRDRQVRRDNSLGGERGLLLRAVGIVLSSLRQAGLV